MVMTKHEQILKHIEGLKIGSKISVRKIAKDMEVSEGTAYRAIKEAENLGLVSTKERIGTVRVEKKNRNNIDKLTFGEVVNIVDGDVLGGERGLGKSLNKFVIGAMEQDAMLRYIDEGSLLIVGNRVEAHRLALEQGAGVLITGGFETSEDVRTLADGIGLPVITCGYDTFTVAAMINRAIYDRLIKKKIMLIEDLISPKQQFPFLKGSNTVEDWRNLLDATGHSRFPVVDEWNRVIGIITSKDIWGAPKEQSIDKLMTRNPLTVTKQTSVATAAHMMVWEGIDVLPVTDNFRKLIAVITRKDVLKALQYIQKQPQIGETFQDLIWSGFEQHRDESGNISFRGMVTPQMANPLGTVAEGVLMTLMTQAANLAVKVHKKGDLVLENMSTYFIKPLPIESEIEIRTRIMEISRKFGKVDVDVMHQGGLICRAMLTSQMIDHT